MENARKRPFLDSKIIDRLVHDAIKPVRGILGRYQLEAEIPESVPPLDTSLRQAFIDGLASVRQVLEDLQGLASCDDETAHEWRMFDWKTLIQEHVDTLRKKDRSFQGPALAKSILSQGNISLLHHALYNMAWFVSHFSNHLAKMECTARVADGESRIVLAYEVDTIAEPLPELCEGKPFVPMIEEERALQANTGLILFTINRILELHNGALVIRSHGKKVMLTLMCPIVAPKEA